MAVFSLGMISCAAQESLVRGKRVRSDKSRLRCFEEWWQPKNTKPEVKEFTLKGAECSLS